MRRGVLPTWLLAGSLVLLLVARRVLDEGTAQQVIQWLAVAGLVGSAAWRGSLAASAAGDTRKVELRLLWATGGVLGSLALYALTTDWGLKLLGVAGNPDSKVPTVLGVLWVAGFVVSGAALLFIELAYRRMPIAEAVEFRRVRTSAQAGVGLALSVVFLFSINYAANARDHKVDLSYFKTTKPSVSTLRMVKALNKPVTIYLFFPEVNEVLDQIRPYFQEVASMSDRLKLKVRDYALAPKLARDQRVRGNGFVVMVRDSGPGHQLQQFEIGTKLDQARDRLKKLDASFQESFMRLTRERREVYLTSGHGELSNAGSSASQDPTQRFEDLTMLFRRSNVMTRRLGVAQGLANEVPPDAPAVVIVGPTKPFLPEEARALLKYVQNGGRVVLMVDPDVDSGLDPFLHPLGVTIPKGVLVSDHNFLRRTQTDADRGNVYSNRYTSHPTVTLASRHASQVATIFVHGGAVQKYDGKDVLPNVKLAFPLRSTGNFWLDQNGNYQLDQGTEKEGQQNMIAAITVPNKHGDDGRVVVIPDGNFVSDALLRNAGNGLVFGDIMQWFLGQEQIAGDVSSEEDVRIMHTRDQDKYWFYGTSFGAPLPLLGVGIWMAFRRRRRGRKAAGTGKDTRGGKGPEAQNAAVEVSS